MSDKRTMHAGDVPTTEALVPILYWMVRPSSEPAGHWVVLGAVGSPVVNIADECEAAQDEGDFLHVKVARMHPMDVAALPEHGGW